MTDQVHYNEGNEHFVDERFAEAAECYSQALEANDTVPAYYLKRAAALLKLCRYEDALEDAKRAIELDPENDTAYMRKGCVRARGGSAASTRSSLARERHAHDPVPASAASLHLSWRSMRRRVMHSRRD